MQTISNSTTRRELLGMLAAAGFLVACGDDDSGANGDAGGATRTVSDVFGPVEVPTSPKRVVCMEQQTLGNLLAVGFPADRIVGFALGGYEAAAFPELDGRIDVEALENVGDYAEPNAEAIAAVDPDLILLVAEDGNTEFYGPILQQLRQGGRTEELSAERLGEMDHALLFVSDGEDLEGTKELLEANPLWATLPAVQADRVVFVPDVLWGTSYSVLALERQLADLRTALLG
jgi:ABC-type Fe3+-hydroxamate transport system substrate-binding protein